MKITFYRKRKRIDEMEMDDEFIPFVIQRFEKDGYFVRYTLTNEEPDGSLRYDESSAPLKGDPRLSKPKKKALLKKAKKKLTEKKKQKKALKRKPIFYPEVHFGKHGNPRDRWWL